MVSVPNYGEGLSSGRPWGTGVSTLTWVIPAKVRIKPAGQAAQASDYTSYTPGCLAGIIVDTKPV